MLSLANLFQPLALDAFNPALSGTPFLAEHLGALRGPMSVSHQQQTVRALAASAPPRAANLQLDLDAHPSASAFCNLLSRDLL
jgi:hypothetical protein